MESKNALPKTTEDLVRTTGYISLLTPNFETCNFSPHPDSIPLRDDMHDATQLLTVPADAPVSAMLMA